MHTNEEIRKKIMARVYLMYFFRQIGQPAIRTGIFAVAALTALSFVSVPHVIANVAHVNTVTGVIAFFVSAFLKTEFFVQFALVVTGLIGVWSVADILTKHSFAETAHAV